MHSSTAAVPILRTSLHKGYSLSVTSKHPEDSDLSYADHAVKNRQSPRGRRLASMGTPFL